MELQSRPPVTTDTLVTSKLLVRIVVCLYSSTLKMQCLEMSVNRVSIIIEFIYRTSLMGFILINTSELMMKQSNIDNSY